MNSPQLVLALMGIAFFLLGTIWLLRRLFHHRPPSSYSPGGRHKYPEADLFRFRPTFLKIGLASALLTVIFAFSWTNYPNPDRQQFEVGTLELDIEVIPRTADRPKPLPPPPSIIEEVENEKIPDEEVIEFEDLSIKDDSHILEYEKSKKQEPIPMPAPVVMEEEVFPDIFIRAEEMPSLEGCAKVNDRNEKWACTQKAMLAFVYKQIKYPAIARENGVEGTVVAAFVINEEGQLSNIELLRDIGAGCGEEVLRIVDLLNSQMNWSPGKQRGRPVKVRVTLPVKFKLQ